MALVCESRGILCMQSEINDRVLIERLLGSHSLKHEPGVRNQTEGQGIEL